MLEKYKEILEYPLPHDLQWLFIFSLILHGCLSHKVPVYESSLDANHPIKYMGWTNLTTHGYLINSH